MVLTQRHTRCFTWVTETRMPVVWVVGSQVPPLQLPAQQSSKCGARWHTQRAQLKARAAGCARPRQLRGSGVAAVALLPTCLGQVLLVERPAGASRMVQGRSVSTEGAQGAQQRAARSVPTLPLLCSRGQHPRQATHFQLGVSEPRSTSVPPRRVSQSDCAQRAVFRVCGAGGMKARQQQ